MRDLRTAPILPTNLIDFIRRGCEASPGLWGAVIIRRHTSDGESSMSEYAIPQIERAPKARKRQIQLIANGDLRLSANQKCWPEQEKMERALGEAIAAEG